MSDEKITQEGLSRRELLRRSAIVGGNLVWMAPAVQTLAKPAFASHGTNTATSRTRCYRYQYALSTGASSAGRPFVATPEAYTTSPNGCNPTDGNNAADAGGPSVSVTGTTGGTGSGTYPRSATITVNGVGEGDRDNCRLVNTTYVSATQANNTCVAPSSVSQDGKTATVTQSGTTSATALTRLRFVVCCSPT